MNKKQEAIEKILELCKDDVEREVQRQFYDYLVFGDSRIEFHADGVKESQCPFCAPDYCEQPHCPYTKERDEDKN